MQVSPLIIQQLYALQSPELSMNGNDELLKPAEIKDDSTEPQATSEKQEPLFVIENGRKQSAAIIQQAYENEELTLGDLENDKEKKKPRRWGIFRGSESPRVDYPTLSPVKLSPIHEDEKQTDPFYLSP